MTTLDFGRVRPLFRHGRMTQSQVDGINGIVTAFDRIGDGNRQHLAYILATAFHETDQTMQPIREYGLGKKHPYGKVDGTGKAPYGRGLVQLTWADNYRKADKELGLGGRLAADYDVALEPGVATAVLVKGCLEGWFTGKKLSDFGDFKHMRRVINGMDRADLIAGYAREFEAALSA